MSGKTRHFAKAGERFSRQEIKEGFKSLEDPENPTNQEIRFLEEELDKRPS